MMQRRRRFILVAAAVFATIMSLVTLYFLSFIENKIQGRKMYSYWLTVTNLNEAIGSINRVLHENSLSAANFNFKKEAGLFRVWFNVTVPKETNVRILQRLSEIPEITQLEAGNRE